MGLCFAPDCNHTNKNGCKMFRFPTDVKLKEKWERLLRRGDRKSTKFSVVCSCHFKDGEKSNLPTTFKRNIDKIFTITSPEKRKRRYVQTNPSPHMTMDLPSTSKGIPSETLILDTICTDVSREDEERPTSSASGERSVSRTTCASSSSLEAENYFLQQEVDDLKNQIQNLKLAFTFEVIENNEKLLSMYTGLPDKVIFLSVFKYLDSQKFYYYLGWNVTKISRKDQFLMTLMKLRLNLLHEDLALRFNCSSATVTNIILTWIHLMHICLFEKFMKDNIPSREKNKTCMPSAFLPFSNCRIVIDCTEVYTAVPSQLDRQKYTYSNYKHRNTLKGLVGVAPNGTITYLSDLYTGNTSDKKIVKHCGILSSFKAGDLILADKGFLISDILPAGISVNIPPFLMKSQFSPEEARQTVVIAKARIHVERAIARIKRFKILSYIPAKLRPYASKIFQICGFLTSLNYPLIKEVEDMYETQE